MAGGELHQGRAGGVAEALIGAADRLAQFGFGKAFRDEGLDDAEGGLLVADPLERGDGGGVHLGHRLGDIEAAVAGEPGQHRLGKGQGGGLPAGGDIAHQSPRVIGRRIRQTSAIVIPRQIAAKENHWIA